MFPRQEDLVGDGEIQNGFLLSPFEARATLKLGWHRVWCPYGEPGSRDHLVQHLLGSRSFRTLCWIDPKA